MLSDSSCIGRDLDTALVHTCHSKQAGTNWYVKGCQATLSQGHTADGWEFGQIFSKVTGAIYT